MIQGVNDRTKYLAPKPTNLYNTLMIKLPKNMGRVEGSPPRTGLSPITVVMFVIVILVLGLGGWYLVSHHNKTNKNSSAASSQASSQGAKVTATSEKLNLKEFGVTVPVPSDLKGLKYSTTTSPDKIITIINLQLDQYTSMANKCTGAAANTSVVLASLVKSTGQYQPNQMPPSINLKQFPDFYIGSIGGSLPQGVTCKDQTTQKQYDDLFMKLSTALTSAFNSAQLSQ